MSSEGFEEKKVDNRLSMTVRMVVNAPKEPTPRGTSKIHFGST